MTGCAGVGVGINLTDFVLDTGVEYIAYEIGVDNPGQIDTAIEVCDSIIAGTIQEDALKLGIDYLLAEYTGHPVLGSRVLSLSSYIEIGDGSLDLEKVKELAPVFKQGLMLAK